MALTYQGFVGSTGGGPDVTFSSLSIGTASADRWVIFGLMIVRFSSTSETVALSSGDTAVQVGTLFTSGGRNIVFYMANIAAGTTVNLTLTGNAGASSFYETGCAVWTEDAGEPILFDQDGVAKPSFGADMVASVDVDASGIVIAMATHGFNSGGGTYTGLTEDFDVTSPTNISGASDDGLSSETARTITLAVGGGEFENLIKVISLTPPSAGGTVTGTSAITYPAFITSVDGDRGMLGTIDAAFPAFQADGVGFYRTSGAVAGTFPSLLADLTGDVIPPIEGIIDATLPAFTVSATADVRPPLTGTVAATFPALGASLLGTVNTNVTGTVEALFSGLETTSQGFRGVTATGNAVFGGFEAAAVGVAGRVAGDADVVFPAFVTSSLGSRGSAGTAGADFASFIASGSGQKGATGSVAILLTSLEVSAIANRGSAGAANVSFPMLEAELTQSPNGGIAVSFPAFGCSGNGYAGGKNTIQLVTS